MSSDTAELLKQHVEATAKVLTNEKPDKEVKANGDEPKDHNGKRE